jgi:aspartate/methionine/tyrosine aminotransferase
MTRVANQYGAINLSQGFPDADPPPEVLAAGKKAMAEGPHQYAVTWGAPRFREALAKKQRHWMGIDLDPEAHVVVTCGSTEAMMTAMMTACNPGDKVIIFSPYYENYGADTILSGAQPIYVPLHPPDLFSISDELRPLFMQKPKALVLCNPSNPSGKVFSLEELEIHRRPGPGVRRLCHHRRSLRTHCLRPPPPPLHGRPCRACSSEPSPAAPCPRPTT